MQPFSESENRSSQEIEGDFTNFLTRYDQDRREGEPNAIDDAISSGKHRVLFRFEDIRAVDPDLAKHLADEPVRYFPAFEKALNTYIQSKPDGPTKNTQEVYHIAMEGSLGDKIVNPRELDTSRFGKMICVEGIVTKASLVRPKLVKVVQYCEETGKYARPTYLDDQTMLTNNENALTTTSYPTKDLEGHQLTTEYGYCEYRNHQTITIQEMPESSPLGQVWLPRSVDIYLNDDLVDHVKPGDRVRVYGIYKILCNPHTSHVTAGSIKPVILANHISVISMNNSNVELTPDWIGKIRELSKNPNIYHILCNSIAPSIKGHDYIKQALLLLLLGGKEHVLDNEVHLRGDINVLLVGDPSCGKSQFLRFVLNTAPLAVNTTGKGSSGVGLTAAIVRDQDTGERRIEGGAMVLADRGVICIDEFDKMLEKDRVAIHEVMEQQSITISKGGIYCSLNARCSVLAAANPVYGQYDITKTPQDNIGLPDSLLSRFDLLFIVRDEINTEKDREIANHVLHMHQYTNPNSVEEEEDEEEDTTNTKIFVNPNEEDKEKRLTIQFLKKYLKFAKEKDPEMTDESQQYLCDAYSQLRQKSDLKTLPVTARVLESMIRLATAHAKARLSPTIEISDCESVLDLICYSLYHDTKIENKALKRQPENEFELMDTNEDPSEQATKQSKRTSRIIRSTQRRRVIEEEDEEEEEEEMHLEEDEEEEEEVEDEQYIDIDTESEVYLTVKQQLSQLRKKEKKDHFTTEEILEKLGPKNYKRMQILAILDKMDEEGVIMRSVEDGQVSWFLL